MDLIKVLSNPVRLQVIQYLQIQGEATTRQIAEAIPDIPAPTLYRHINALLKEGALLVKEERKVRGSLERLLSVNKESFSAAENNIADLSYQFLMGIFMRFQRYSCKNDADPQRDRLSMRTAVLKLTDESFDKFMCEIWEVIKKHEKNADRGGKLRSISFVSAPLEEDET